jgi:hypothetical protein
MQDFYKKDEGRMLRERCVWISFVAILFSLGVLGLTLPAAAQDATPAKPGAAPSSGLSASINSISVVNNRQIVVQIAIQNISKGRIYLLVFGSNQAATDTGLIGTESQDTTGLNHCFLFTGQDDAFSYKDCFVTSGSNHGKALDIDQYSYIEPNDTIAVSMAYNFGQEVTRANTLSFAFKAIVRNATGDVDLPGADIDKLVGKPHPVNLNFTLLPIKKD